MIYLERDNITLHQGDALSVLKSMEKESVHCVVTSPPYYALRDYGTAQWEGGDNSECDHQGKVKATQAGFNQRYTGKPPKDTDKQSELRIPFKQICGKCGAVRIDDQIGLEDTPQQYIARLVAVFEEVKRVLRKDGTLWINMGDSYTGSANSGAKATSTTNGKP